MLNAPGLPAGFSPRPPTMADAPAVLALMNARDIADYGEPDSELEDFIYDWEEADLQHDGWLIEGPDSSLAAYGLVQTWSGGIDIECYAHPDVPQIVLQAYLLDQAERRARALLAGTAAVLPVARAFVNHGDAATGDAFVTAGYHVKKYHFRMQIDQTEPPPEPVWPTGCQLRTLRAGEDDQAIFRFIQKAFDQPGRTPPTFDEWRNFMMRPDHFLPDLWFLLTCDEEIVGAAVCYDYQPYGWVRHLAVDQRLRRQGIGTSLLQHVFGVFYRRGQMRVALGVDAANESAYRLYEQAGMQRARQFDEYHKPLG